MYIAYYVVSGLLQNLLQAGDKEILATIQPKDFEQLVVYCQKLWPIGLISFCLGIVFVVGYNQYILQSVRGNSEFNFNLWKQPYMLYVNIALAKIIVGIIVVLGFVCCILPGIYLCARLQYTTFNLIDNKEDNAFTAIGKSWDMTKGNGLTLFGLQFIYLGIIIIGLLCCCVGIFFAPVVITFIEAAVYFALTDSAPVDTMTEE